MIVVPLREAHSDSETDPAPVLETEMAGIVPRLFAGSFTLGDCTGVCTRCSWTASVLFEAIGWLTDRSAELVVLSVLISSDLVCDLAAKLTGPSGLIALAIVR